MSVDNVPFHTRSHCPFPLTSDDRFLLIEMYDFFFNLKSEINALFICEIKPRKILVQMSSNPQKFFCFRPATRKSVIGNVVSGTGEAGGGVERSS